MLVASVTIFLVQLSLLFNLAYTYDTKSRQMMIYWQQRRKMSYVTVQQLRAQIERLLATDYAKVQFGEIDLWFETDAICASNAITMINTPTFGPLWRRKFRKFSK